MSKIIIGYKAKLNMPGYKKGDEYKECGDPTMAYPDAFEPIFEAPPGIIEFKNLNTKLTFGRPISERYNNWANRLLASKEHAVNTIKIFDVDWTVGDKIEYSTGFIAEIKGFKWELEQWIVYNDTTSHNLYGCKKFVNKPIKILSIRYADGHGKHFPSNTIFAWAEYSGIKDAGGKILKIEENDKTWEVDEYTMQGYIKDLMYTTNGWIANLDNPYLPQQAVSKLDKPVYMDPVVVLQGKKLFFGDKYWKVYKNNDIHEMSVGRAIPPCIQFDNEVIKTCFSTRELAEAYAKENKPVYPANIVEEAIYAMDKVRRHNQTNDCHYLHLNVALQKLQNFKSKL